MTITMIRPGVFLSPVPRPIRGTLLDAAAVNDNVSSQGLVGLFDSYNCLVSGNTAVQPCPPTVMAAPVQSAASTSTTGGTLAAGTYRAKITAVNARGETVASNEVSQATTGSTSRVILSWAAVTGATSYRVYVTNGATNTETFLLDVGNVLTYNWTGTPAYSAAAAAPPTANSAVVSVTKTFNAPAWQDAFQFAVYTGVKCKAVSFDQERAATELERVFSNKESVSVARALMQTRFIAGSGWSAATDLTPAAGAVDPVVGLGILEGHAGWAYAGAPTLHVPRTIGSLLLNKYGAIEYEGDTLRTILGSKVAADSGYEYTVSGGAANISPAGVAAPAGELWLYASGEVSLAASEPIQKGGLINLNETTDSNNISLLRERMYIAAVDCYTAAVRVKVQ